MFIIKALRPSIGPSRREGPDTLNPNGQAVIPALWAYIRPRPLVGALAINLISCLAARGAGALPLPLALPMLHQGMPHTEGGAGS